MKDFDMKAVKAKLAAMNEEIAAVRKKCQDDSRSMILDTAQDFFEAYPEIKSFVWNQYTPYWNDGDECVFCVNDINYCVDRSYDAHGLTEWDVKGEPEDDDDVDFYEGDPFRIVDSVKTKRDIKTLSDAIEDHTAGKTQHDSEAISSACVQFRHVVVESSRWNGPSDRFNVNKATVYLNQLKESIRETEEDDVQYPNKDAAAHAAETFIEMLREIDYDTMKDIFGDHVSVCIDRKGIHVEECEHD